MGFLIATLKMEKKLMYIIRVKRRKTGNFSNFFVFKYRQEALSFQHIISDRFYQVKVCKVRGL